MSHWQNIRRILTTLALTLFFALPATAQDDPVGQLIAGLRANEALADGNFTVIFAVTALPGSAETLEMEMTAILEPTRNEPGNVTFRLFKDTDVAGRMFIFETWESVDALAAHLRMPYISRAFEVYAEHTEEQSLVMFGLEITP